MSDFKRPPGVVKESSHFSVAAFARSRAGDFVEAPSEKVFLSEHIGLRLRVLL
jgi:hypothetical protein